MPLRDVGRWQAWLERDQPSAKARLVVAEFLLAICGRPWAAPSVPVSSLSDQPVSEVRSAELAVPGETGVTVYYRQYFAAGEVDIIDVAQVVE